MRTGLWVQLCLTALITGACVTPSGGRATGPAADTSPVMASPALRAPRTGGRTAGVASGEKMTTLAVAATNRMILMRYVVDLNDQNRHTRAVAEPMALFEDQMRQCYLRRLERRPYLKGTLDLRVSANKGAQRLGVVTRTGGTIRDRRLQRCITGILARVPMLAPDTIEGRIRYHFAVTADSTRMLTSN